MFGTTLNSNADSSRLLVHTNKSIYSTACKSKILKNNLTKAATAATTITPTNTTNNTTAPLLPQYHQDSNTNLNSNYVSSRYLHQSSCYCNTNTNTSSICNCSTRLSDRNLNRSYKADRSLRLSDKSPVFKRNVSTTTTASLFNQPIGTALTKTTASSSSTSCSNINNNTNANVSNTKTFLFNKNNLSPSINKRSNNLVWTFGF